MSLDEAQGYATRIIVIREPVRRLRSAWRHGWPQVPWEEFVPHVLSEPAWDIHTAPYADRAAIATHVLTLEQLDLNWPLLELPALPERLNVRGVDEGRDIIPFAEEITLAFERDDTLWQRVNARGGLMLQ